MEPLFLKLFAEDSTVALVCAELSPPPVVLWSIYGFLLLALWVLIAAWRGGPDRVATYLMGFLFGYSIEWANVVTGAYCYQFGPEPLYLPGQVPLYVSCGWAMIFYCAYYTSLRLSSSWLKVATLSGLLALALDLLLDPGTVALGLWQWQPPAVQQAAWPWYSVPWSNFVGWFLLIFSLALAQYLLVDRKRDRSRDGSGFGQREPSPGLLLLIWRKLGVMLAGYAGFGLLYALYAYFSSLAGDLAAQTILHSLLLLLAVGIVCRGGMKRSRATLAPTCLLVPLYLLLCAGLYLYQVAGELRYQPLVFLFPVYAFAVMAAYFLPYRKFPAQAARAE